MARHDLRLHLNAYLGVADDGPPIDRSIRCGLPNVFSSPADKQAPDESFHLLLAALAQRTPKDEQPKFSCVGHRS